MSGAGCGDQPGKSGVVPPGNSSAGVVATGGSDSASSASNPERSSSVVAVEGAAVAANEDRKGSNASCPPAGSSGDANSRSDGGFSRATGNPNSSTSAPGVEVAGAGGGGGAAMGLSTSFTDSFWAFSSDIDTSPGLISAVFSVASDSTAGPPTNFSGPPESSASSDADGVSGEVEAVGSPIGPPNNTSMPLPFLGVSPRASNPLSFKLARFLLVMKPASTTAFDFAPPHLRQIG